MSERQVKVFLIHGPRHNTEMTVDRAYPVIQMPIETHDPKTGKVIQVAQYERLLRSFNTGLWIYEYKGAA